ncbi:uncharacterized protein A1O5_11176 [Cladophialophora psammophila CBS 110553]|uniref:BTB domain-containing protein n=1 Tax=Cladophialophora psammophila CBS 110553 TaxID=1182543 RepID=W9X5B4_9EURO|nr:uncharacterized protein A1O5_11176 [Cladophialophora psammophila CBS 110553]EXJ65649.1 hypothetical protein A1O5_11176 [Cladophialophora psammophila CBS 110553]
MSAKKPKPIMVRMMESGEFSDLKFLCNGQEFKVRKAVVCVQSPMIKAATRGQFKEANTNIIVMDSFHPTPAITTLTTMSMKPPRGKLPEMTSMKLKKKHQVCREIKVSLIAMKRTATNFLLEEPPLPLPQGLNATASLFENIRVNSIGDYYRIDELVSLANTKI